PGTVPRRTARHAPAGGARLLVVVRTREPRVRTAHRTDGTPQASPVTGGVDGTGRIVISSYPERAKSHNLRRDPRCSVLVLSDDFGGAWVQLDGVGEVVGLPEALEPLVEYFRAISGEHPNWDEYREAMTRQGKVLLRIRPTRWGPIATGGFPARLAD